MGVQVLDMQSSYNLAWSDEILLHVPVWHIFYIFNLTSGDREFFLGLQLKSLGYIALDVRCLVPSRFYNLYHYDQDVFYIC